jgi:hypothetical protein
VFAIRLAESPFGAWFDELFPAGSLLAVMSIVFCFPLFTHVMQVTETHAASGSKFHPSR